MSQLPPRRGRASDAFGFLPLSSDPCGSFIEATEIQAEPLQMRESVIGQNGIRPRLFLSQMLLLLLLLLLLLVFLLNVGRVEGKTRVAVVIKFFFNNKVGQGGQEKRDANRCRTFSRPFFFSFFFFFLSYARRKIELGFADDPSGGLSRPTPIKRWLRVRDYRWGNNVLRKEADRKIIEGIFRLLF